MTTDDRKTLDQARRWIRHLWLEGSDIRIDGIERDGLHELMRKLDDLAAHHSGEPQLAPTTPPLEVKITELGRAGWTLTRNAQWRSPQGTVFITGPHGAWTIMKRMAEHDSNVGQDGRAVVWFVVFLSCLGVAAALGYAAGQGWLP